ncbi:MAG TPA: hypothetical protein DCM05_09265 [Elusimicrobia bacterium]|nr:hypothetical protein [Elusimicrobiota bacterium]
MYDPASDDEPRPKPAKGRSPLLLAAAGVLAVAAGAGLERSLLTRKTAAARPISAPVGLPLPVEAPAPEPVSDRILAKASPDQKLDIGLPEPPSAEEDAHREPPAEGSRHRFSLGRVEWELVVPEGFQPAAPDWGADAPKRGWSKDDGWVRSYPKGEVRLRLHAYFTEFLCRPHQPVEPPREGAQDGLRTLRYRGKDGEEGFVLFVNSGTCIRLSLRSQSPGALQEAMPAFLEAQRSLAPAAAGPGL